jgi:transcriptional regulator with XRE-family HTH domain
MPEVEDCDLSAAASRRRRRQLGTTGTLGERLRVARQRLGMSQEELGMAAGLSQPAVSRLEYGGAPPSQETLGRLAVALGVELAWLQGRAEGRLAPAGGMLPGGTGQMTRLEALAEYRDLLERWRRDEALPSDPRRRRALREVLERTGGVPPELRWRR